MYGKIDYTVARQETVSYATDFYVVSFAFKAAKCLTCLPLVFISHGNSYSSRNYLST